MDSLIDVCVCVQPRPQQRPRWSKATGTAHDPSARDKKLFMQCLRLAIEERGDSMPPAVQRGRAVSISVDYVFERPKSHYKNMNKDNSFRLKKNAPPHMVQKPDIDNCLKVRAPRPLLKPSCSLADRAAPPFAVSAHPGCHTARTAA